MSGKRTEPHRPEQIDIRRATSMEEQLERLQNPAQPGRDVDVDAEQMALFDARWSGVIPASTAEVPADTSRSGRARAVEAYRSGVLAERKKEDPTTDSESAPEKSSDGAATPKEKAESPAG